MTPPATSWVAAGVDAIIRSAPDRWSAASPEAANVIQSCGEL